MIDFERTAINATNAVLDASNMYCCLLFLPESNVFKEVQQNNLAQLYLVNEQFQTNLKMVSTIAFVPTNNIFNSFEILTQECGDDDQPILDYFESNYIGEVRKGVRRLPLF